MPNNLILRPRLLGCTQRECARSNDIVTNYRDMFETEISAGAKQPHSSTTYIWVVLKESVQEVMIL